MAEFTTNRFSKPQENNSILRHQTIIRQIGSALDVSVKDYLDRFQHSRFRFILHLRTETICSEIFQAISRARNGCKLQSLTLCQKGLGSEVQFLHLLSQSSALESIDFRDSLCGRLTGSLPMALAGVLSSSCPLLSSVRFGKSDVLSHSMLILWSALPKLRCVDLHLGYYDHFEVDINAIKLLLLQCTTLQTLHLGRTSILAQDGKTLCDALRQCTWLRRLHLGENNLQVIKLNTCMSSIQHLELGTNFITPYGILPLSSTISTWSALTSLCLGNNQLGDEGLSSLCPHLSQCQYLRSIKLGRNFIGHVGASSLADCLSSSKSIREVHLGQNQIGDQGFGYLMIPLSCNGTIRRLHLGRNGITSGSFIRVKQTTCHIQSFRWVFSLEVLHLGRNCIDDQALVCIAADFQYCSDFPVLKLHLGSNQIRDHGLRAIVDAAISNPTRIDLDFGRNFYSPFALARASAAISHDELWAQQVKSCNSAVERSTSHETEDLE